MSTVNATKVECDEITAKGGSGIPNNLTPLTTFCYGDYHLGTLYNTINVSSITKKSNYFQINFINNAADKYYTILALRNGDDTASARTVEFYDVTRAKAKNYFGLICKDAGKPVTSVNEFAFAVLSKG